MSSGSLPRDGSDPLIERLERLNQRRSAPTRFPLPPPTQTRPASPRAGEPRAAATKSGPTGRHPVGTLPPPNPPRQPKRRRGPAKVAKAGALLISCVSTGGLAALFAHLNQSSPTGAGLSALPAPIAATPHGGTTATATTTPATTPAAAAPATTATESTATTAAAGTVAAFDGDAVPTRFGPVQVQVQVTGGVVTDVAVIQYPDRDRKSVRINARALPTLRSEALTAQDANVDTVSGATYTSTAYADSLQSAIDQARAARAIA